MWPTALLLAPWALLVGVGPRPAPPRAAAWLAASAAEIPPPPALLDALGEANAQQVWDSRPPGALPGWAKQAALVGWLREVPFAHDETLLYPCLRREPKLLLRAGALDELAESHAALEQLLQGERAPRQFAKAVAHNPELLLAPPAELHAAARHLASAAGLGSDDVARVCLAAPKLLHARAAKVVDARVAWLGERLGVRGGRLRRVVQRAPLVLLASPHKTMEPRLACLLGLGVGADELGALVVRTPAVLHTPCGTLRQRAAWLVEARVLSAADPPSELGRWLRKQPDFFALKTRALNRVLAVLRSTGLSEGQVGAVLRAEPSALSLPTEQLQLRASFFLNVVGGSADELAATPHIFSCDFAKVPMLRHALCVTRGVRGLSPTALMAKGDRAFVDELARVGHELTLDELNAFERAGDHLAFYQGAGM